MTERRRKRELENKRKERLFKADLKREKIKEKVRLRKLEEENVNKMKELLRAERGKKEGRRGIKEKKRLARHKEESLEAQIIRKEI